MSIQNGRSMVMKLNYKTLQANYYKQGFQDLQVCALERWFQQLHFDKTISVYH